MDIKYFWDKAISFPQYLDEVKETFNNPGSNIPEDYLPYYELGIRRMERALKQYKVEDKHRKTLAEKNFNGKILIISEGWCGDASQVVPAIVTFFKDYDVRITYRDQEPSLIDNFLTNGGKSIPVIIFLTEDLKVINSWGPRPKFGMELLQKHKENPESYDKEQFHNDLQVYYSKNKGHDIIEEVLEVIPILNIK